ncbi:unnamed protein product [Clonostachys solani]|uniref:Heterokaryon incompatibility domain-containing protein n=1 Tax=Clonostachys solani TaxID=160281 RepID=A0A9N9YWY5_9HYPO|nr:unnamed protein product [Clonostachys solani]
MKLIHCASGRIESDWAEGVPPPYAILSHTWAQPRDGSPGEVSYQDYVTGRKASPSRNWAKIDKAIQVAVEDGLEYIWIDSCCIDKTSSAELSEAINSMFQWYAAATVCYAHLEGYDKEAKGKLASCKWFYRGWTLQELIAPARVEFYDKDWKNLGSRQSLSDAIADITSVDREILLADSVETTSRLLYQTPIAKRFSWASKRATTRPEDLAYCLLGIFQVNMPLLYGEGRRAFIRLQKEIMKDSDDLTIFAWQAPPGYKESMSEFRGILASSADEFSLPAEVMPTHAAGFNPIFEATNKGLKIDVPLKTTANSEDMWMSLNCRYGFEYATLGVLLRYQGANRYIRSKPQALEFEPPGEWTRPGQIFIILDTAVAITTILEPSAVHQNSFAFSLNDYRLQMVSVSHPNRWYQPKNTMNTYGEPNFVGCYFFRTRKTLVLLETDIVLAFGVGSRGEPWACLGIGKGRKARAGMQGKVEMNTDLYDAAVEEKWDRVRQLGMTQQIHGIRIYHSVDGAGKWGLFASVAPLEMASKEGIYNVKIGCEPFSDSSFAPGLKGALKPV